MNILEKVWRIQLYALFSIDVQQIAHAKNVEFWLFCDSRAK